MATSFLLASFGLISAENVHQAPRATAEEVKMDFWDLPPLEKAFISTEPEMFTDKLKVGKLGLDGGNKASILKLAKELAENEHGKYDSLLISHKDKLLFESYFNSGRIDLAHFQSSVTKGFTSLVLARAIQLGYVTMAELHKPIVSFFDDLDTSNLSAGAELVTLHQALSMRSGLRFSDEQLKDFRTNRDKYKGTAQIQAFLELSQPVTKASQVYKYQGSDPILVMHVINSVVPGSAKEFVEREFFSKMGITNYKWRLDPIGMPIGDNGFDLNSRDMLKTGKLLANNGKWKNEQLLSAEYLAAAFEPITKASESWQPEGFNYGYLWYQTDIVLNNKKYNVTLTWGGGGNRIILVNALDLIIVITGQDMEDKVFEPLIEAILPAFING